MDQRNLHLQAQPIETFRRPYQPGCMGCLSRVPCASVFSWAILLLGCGMYVGGTFVGLKFLRELFQQSAMFPYLEWVSVGVAGFTLFVATNFLLINSCSSGVTSHHVLITKARNSSASCCISFSLFLAYILQLVWTIVLCIHCAPVVIVLGTTWFKDPTLKGCIDLRHYGLRASNDSLTVNTAVSNNTANSTVSYTVSSGPWDSAHICGNELAYYEDNNLELFIPLSVALGGALLCLISMMNFVICLAGNAKHVKELRHLPYTRGCDEYAEVECEFNGHNGRKHHDPAADKMLGVPR